MPNGINEQVRKNTEAIAEIKARLASLERRSSIVERILLHIVPPTDNEGRRLVGELGL